MFGLSGSTSRKAGLPPGTPVYIGRQREERVRITVIDYDEHDFTEKEAVAVEDCFGFKETPSVTWINVDGLHEVALVERIGRHYGLHPLVVEDIVHTNQRTKLESFDDYVFLVLRMHFFDPERNDVESEQVSMVLFENVLITFQERPGDIFEPVRARIKNAIGKIRKAGPDFLAYALMDAIVDNYFLVLEKAGESVEDLEEELLGEPGPSALGGIRLIKSQTMKLRRSVWPLRELIGSLDRGEVRMVKEPTRIYLRDLYDHTIQVIDAVETLRETVSGMFDLYLSSISNRMNSVMKVLTVFAAVFIPLTFIAGVYGMNFEYMPELKWRYGYFAVLLLMLAVAAGMFVYFIRKKWL